MAKKKRIAVKQRQNQGRRVSPNSLANLVPYIFKPGQSGNPKGRPKGKTLKEWVRERLLTMTDEERVKFLGGMPRDIVWRMAEGNPHQTEEHSGGIKITGVSIKVRK